MTKEQLFLTKDHKSMIVKGLTQSGKTYFVKNYIRAYHKRYTHVIILSGTADVNMEYSDLLTGEYNNIRMFKYSLTTLNEVYNWQYSHVIQTNNKNMQTMTKYYEDKKTNRMIKKPKLVKPKSLLLVLDDYIKNTDSKKSKGGEEVFTALGMQSRHILTSVIYITQQIVGRLKTITRDNIERLVLIGKIEPRDLTEAFNFLPDFSVFPNVTYWIKAYMHITGKDKRGICVLVKEADGFINFYEGHKFDKKSNKIYFLNKKDLLTENEYINEIQQDRATEAIRRIETAVTQTPVRQTGQPTTTYNLPGDVVKRAFTPVRINFEHR